MDSLAQRFFVENAERDRRYVAGWEAASAEHLGALAEAVEKSGIPVTKEAAARADDRRVNELVSFIDPMGNRVELFTGPHPAGAAFVPGRSISGFRTRSIGLGHVVYSVTDIEVAADFYRNVLGFNLSDYTIEPFKARFFHINSRHHSLALVQSPENGLHHLMIELNQFDDVGQGYDLALAKDEAIGVTLGRHSNDYVTSFYLRSPSGFLVEYGWGGREIDPGSWAPHELEFGPSLWGHDRSWLPEDLRKAANDLTKASAAAGNRAPVQVMEGNFVRSKMEG
jgi:2,3-dihydroxybiphenyl 1,2-dioxygenase